MLIGASQSSGPSELYAQLMADGLKGVSDQIAEMRANFESVKRPTNEMADSMGKARTGAETVSSSIGKIGSMALAQLGPLGRLASVLKAIWGMIPSSASKSAMPNPIDPKATGANPMAAGGMSTGAMAGVGVVIAVVGAAAHHAMSMVDDLKASILSMAKAGFQGTTELFRLNLMQTLISREIAGALVPALNLLTRGLESVYAFIKNIGGTGQQVFAGLLIGVMSLSGATTLLGIAATAVVFAFSPILLILTAVVAGVASVGIALYLAYTNSRELRAAISTLGSALGSMLSALEPFGSALLGIGSMLLKAFVIDPLIKFVNYLTVAVRVLERMATLVAKVLGISGLKIPDSPKTAVTLNQVGSESAEATFSRIQEAIYQVGSAEEKEDYAKDTASTLKGIDRMLDEFFLKVDRFLGAIPTNPGQMINGAANNFLDDVIPGRRMFRGAL